MKKNIIITISIISISLISLAGYTFYKNYRIKHATKIVKLTTSEVEVFTETRLQDLIQTIKDESKEKSDGLLIQASGNSSHQSVVRLMDTARNAGVQSISIVEL